MNENFAPSLLNFLHTNVLTRLSMPDIKVLEIGSGICSLFEKTDLNKKMVDAIDLKIDIDYISNSGISYSKVNIAEPNSLKNDNYELVFDSHCLHCLKSNLEQEIAIKNIYAALKPGGIFASEVMVQPGANKVLFPGRTVRETIDLEAMILNSGFKIIYFVLVPQMNFYFEINKGEIVCDMLRVIAKK